MTPRTGRCTAVNNTLALSYFPTLLAVRSEVLTFGGRQFNQVVIGGDREGSLWRANLVASELNGYLEYRQPNEQASGGAEGRVYARLARLTLAPGVEDDVEALLDAQPASIPALDIVVDDFELRGKHLGRLEVEAVNRSRLSGAARGRRARVAPEQIQPGGCRRPAWWPAASGPRSRVRGGTRPWRQHKKSRRAGGPS